MLRLRRLSIGRTSFEMASQAKAPTLGRALDSHTSSNGNSDRSEAAPPLKAKKNEATVKDPTIVPVQTLLSFRPSAMQTLLNPVSRAAKSWISPSSRFLLNTGAQMT
eukprot:TRINITY_DN10594_c1_g1_i14.p3 TRINITY_DN10594_c1_g1~~TRINITY_DN10594_c1_g1_i14.p3  ORF type:complete len:107 (+),score=13.56 TRINITY_DN10594_c1_g1_i14:1025-1345(+)